MNRLQRKNLRPVRVNRRRSWIWLGIWFSVIIICCIITATTGYDLRDWGFVYNGWWEIACFAAFIGLITQIHRMSFEWNVGRYSPLDEYRRELKQEVEKKKLEIAIKEQKRKQEIEKQRYISKWGDPVRIQTRESREVAVLKAQTAFAEGKIDREELERKLKLWATDN